MKLDDIQSKELLPRFAAKIAWMMNALDIVIKAVKSRIPAIEAPLTMQAIQTLSEEELEAWYNRFGVVEYYPELSRETREKMLYWLARFYRYLGTPESVHVLCDYIFDNAPLGVEVWDNLAFNDEGELVDSSLLDLFDIFINAHTSTIGIAQYDRIVANVLKIARNSQALRNIYFRYEDELSIPVRCADYIGFVYRIGDDYELSRPTGSAEETLELLLGMRSSGSGTNDWISVTYSAGTGYWAGILSNEDKQAAEAFGLQVHTNKWAGNIGGLIMDYTYSVRLLNVYSDIGQTEVESGDNWIFRSSGTTSVTLMYFIISNTVGFSTSVMSYKARFIKHESAIINTHPSSPSFQSGTAKEVYDDNEKLVFFDNGKKYTLMGVYLNDTLLETPFKLETYANSSYKSCYFRIKQTSGSTVSADKAVIKIENVEERELWFKTDKTDYTYDGGGYHEMYNEFGNIVYENYERNLQIQRFVKANGDVLELTPTELAKFQLASYSSSNMKCIIRENTTGLLTTIKAAKVVYKSLPLT